MLYALNQEIIFLFFQRKSFYSSSLSKNNRLIVYVENLKTNGHRKENLPPIFTNYSASFGITTIFSNTDSDDCSCQLLELQWLYDDSRLYPR